MADDMGADVERLSTDTPKQSTLPPDSPLRPIAASWLKKIAAAKRAKSAFDADAREAMNFFDGGAKWFFESSQRGLGLTARPTPAPAFRIVVNRVFEAVKILGAVVYNRNPNRTVTPRKFPVVPPEMLGIDPNAYQTDPMTGQPMPDPALQTFIETSHSIGMEDQKKATQARLLESYLNWTPNENNLKSHGRQAVDEAIIKGAGVMWTEAVEQPSVPPAEPTLVVGSFFDSVDNLLLDPDAQVIEEITWCAKRCVAPLDQVARMFSLSREDLKANLESYDSASQSPDQRNGDSRNDAGNRRRRTGRTNDLVTYYKIWSKCGFGDRLKDAKKEDRGLFDPLGDQCYIVVADGVPYPLNTPPSVLKEQVDEEGLPASLRVKTSWPIPLWADNNGWPFEMYAPHRKPNTLWPISHIRPGVGELRFVNWAMSFLVTRIAVSCETIVGVSKAADQDIKDQLLAPSDNGFKILEISESLGRSVQDIVSVFQMPGVTRDLWEIIAAVVEQFDRRVGLTELAYGATRNQMRSASEAQVKQDNMSIRPDDMANLFEDFQSALSRKEAMAARWLLQPKDVIHVLGPLGAQAWQMHLSPKSGEDIGTIAREFDYRIETGSARKPNKAFKVEQMQMALQTLGPVLQGLIGAGVVEPFNALISAWADANDLDAAPFLVPPPPPPPPMPPPGAAPGDASGTPPTEAPDDGAPGGPVPQGAA
jgi:hypothetical protein